MTLLSNRTKLMLLTGIACLFAAGTAMAADESHQLRERRRLRRDAGVRGRHLRLERQG